MLDKNKAKAMIDAIISLRDSATDAQAEKAAVLYPEWKEGMNYKKGARYRHNGVLYKATESHKAVDVPDKSNKNRKNHN